MRLSFLRFVLIGAALVAAIVVFVFYIQRGAHMQLKGTVQKVRTLATDENSSVAVIDFRAANQADYVWMVRSVEVYMTDAQGSTVPGLTVADADAARLFEYFPLLGQKFNDSLTARTKIGPRQTGDWMIAARFDIPEAQLQSRKAFHIRIAEVDGAVSEISETGPAK
ncbi:MAG: hypothetical protein K6T59_13330 [Bryobacteraceae bacterium]|nr:hypothetical protein [Bryobacteraceae bacterium]